MKTPTRLASILFSAVLTVGLGACGDDADTTDAPIPRVDRIAYSTSTILVQTKEANRSEGAARARAWELWEKVRSGTPFAQVASQNSDDESKIDGGFMGFLPTHHDTALAGALQALRPGQMSPPIRTRIGYQILYRHSFDEAVRMEREKWIWIYGVYVRWDENEGGRERAYDEAERLLAQLKAGETTLSAAKQKYAKDMRVPGDGFLGASANREGRQMLWNALSAVKEGEYAGPVETQFGWGILRRGRYLRALVQHILVQDSTNNLGVPRLPDVAKKLAEKLHKEVTAHPERWSLLVKNHSDDLGSRGNNGLLETITCSAMPAAFEELVRETPPGKIAARPVYTDSGWHIVWRLK